MINIKKYSNGDMRGRGTMERTTGNGPIYWTVSAVSLEGKQGKFSAEQHFLDFLSGFEYNKLELLWITIATYR